MRNSIGVCLCLCLLGTLCLTVGGGKKEMRPYANAQVQHEHALQNLSTAVQNQELRNNKLEHNAISLPPGYNDSLPTKERKERTIQRLFWADAVNHKGNNSPLAATDS